MVEDFLVSESDNSIAPLFKVMSSFLILNYLTIFKMILTVYLNNKFIFKIDEVSNMLSDDMLSTKLVTTLFSF